jgi:hypothetical protein
MRAGVSDPALSHRAHASNPRGGATIPAADDDNAGRTNAGDTAHQTPRPLFAFAMSMPTSAATSDIGASQWQNTTCISYGNAAHPDASRPWFVQVGREVQMATGTFPRILRSTGWGSLTLRS